LKSQVQEVAFKNRRTDST